MNELIVSSGEDGLRIGILEDKRIVELHHEKTNKLFSVGDIYLGKVRKIVPGLNAAFVDIGHPKDAFLHYLDLGPQVRSLNKYVKSVQASGKNIRNLGNVRRQPDINKHGKITQVLKNNQPILVQVVKEAISTKGPRLSCEISIPGQFLILVPFSDDVSVSRKLKASEEKRRLRTIADKLKPKNFGIIVRTAAENKGEEALERDLNELVGKWNEMCRSIVQARPPKRVLREEDRTTSILRDMLSIGFDSIVTDHKESYDEIHETLKKRMPEKIRMLKFFKGGKAPLFETMGLEKQIKSSFGKTVTMQSGAYLVIEHTEALHVIDVNSGSKHLSGETLEENALKINSLSATEIARQLRLRDMGGIIVVDFIDLKKSENKKVLYHHLKEAMKKDRAKHSILPMSRFGLVQITRQRVRPELNIVTSETCPSCGGTGKIQPAILLVDEIENNVDFLMRQNREKRMSIYVHPFVEAYLKKGFMNFPRRWYLKFWGKIKVIGDTSLPFTVVKYYNGKGEEIKL